jgi:hypothetical protein
MRDPARIPAILDRLRKVWEAHPDLRLGQLVVNGATVRPQLDPFYIEDEALITRLEVLGRSTRPTLAAALNAELDRLEAGAKSQLQRDSASDSHFRFEDGVLSAVATIRERFQLAVDDTPLCANDQHVWNSRSFGEYVWCINCPARKDGK